MMEYKSQCEHDDWMGDLNVFDSTAIAYRYSHLKIARTSIARQYQPVFSCSGEGAVHPRADRRMLVHEISRTVRKVVGLLV